MESLTEEQFRTWWAFHLFVEPLEASRMDRRFGLLVACLEAMLFGDEAGYNPANFELCWRERQQKEGPDDAADWQVIKAKAEQILQAHYQGR